MAEAAQCTIHIAALVAETLARDASLNKFGMVCILTSILVSYQFLGLPSGCASFKFITPNVAIERIIVYF